jgi:hypothetical protein
MTQPRKQTAATRRHEPMEGEGDLTPAEAACTRMERAYVYWLFQLPPKLGHKVAAARLAGFGQKTNSDPNQMTALVGDLERKQRVCDLIEEVARKKLRGLFPKALGAYKDILDDPDHRDRAKVAQDVIERIEPTRQKIDVNVRHEIVDRDKEMVAYLRKLKSLNVSRDKLEEELGYSDLPRYERLLMLEDAAKNGGPVIEAEYEEVQADG